MTGRYYPIFLDVERRPCLIVGGGDVAGRKAATLTECGALVIVVAPDVGPAISELAEHEALTLHQRPFDRADVEGVALVIAATGSQEVNRAVYDEAMSRSIPVNVVDQPELCTFIVPSTVHRGDLTLAASTGGKSPAVAKRVRLKLEAAFGAEWGPYIDIMGKARQSVLAVVEGQARREEIFNRLADSALFERVASGDIKGARKVAEEVTGLAINWNDE